MEGKKVESGGNGDARPLRRPGGTPSMDRQLVNSVMRERDGLKAKVEEQEGKIEELRAEVRAGEIGKSRDSLDTSVACSWTRQ